MVSGEFLRRQYSTDRGAEQNLTNGRSATNGAPRSSSLAPSFGVDGERTMPIEALRDRSGDSLFGIRLCKRAAGLQLHATRWRRVRAETLDESTSRSTAQL